MECKNTNRILTLLLALFLPLCLLAAPADSLQAPKDSAALQADTTVVDTASATMDMDMSALDEGEEDSPGLYKMIKTKFIEGNAGFMSLVALALVLGLAFCIERIIYLSLSEIDAKKFMLCLREKLKTDGLDAAHRLCGETRGPVAAICQRGLEHADEDLGSIERSVQAYGNVEVAKLEKGCSWIKLFIAIAPSLGFLGTVIGMVMAFDQIQSAGDISPTIVAAGMKVALITTIFGIIVALVLQLFYNFILSKIDHITAQMEESAITLLDIMARYKEGL